jgi:hypothetical protein
MGFHPDNVSGSRPRRGRGALLGILFSAAVAAGALAASAAGDGLVPNPANHKRLVDKPIEASRYDDARHCRKDPTKGAKALADWLDRTVRGESWGINRCERLKRGGNFSIHSEGRAIDWRLDAGIAKERRSAMRLIRTLIASDRNGNEAALARRMGVQGLIFDCKAWWAGQTELGEYSYCYKRNGDIRHDLDRTQAHRDHVHIELNWPGARKRTSFWRSPVSR